MSSYVDGKWISGAGETFASYNPANGETVWEGHAASAAEVDAAVKAAAAAAPEWAALSIEKRIPYLEAYKNALEKNKEKLSEAISKEVGKPLWESKTEVAAMVGKIAVSIDAQRKRCPEITQEHPNGKLVTRHKPHGVIAVFGPFNFPGHLPNGHIVPALLAGNTIVFKPSEYTPLSSVITMQCWEEAHLPQGVLNMVLGARPTGKALAEHPRIDGLFFTGSWPTGKHFAEQFAAQPGKILALEMGGNNPLYVDDVADPRSAAYITIQSAYLTAGQRCTCARRLLVPSGAKGDAFLTELVNMVKGIAVGPYTAVPEPFMGPVISARAAQQLLEAQQKLIKMGGTPLLEMRLLENGTGLLSPGLIDMTAVPNRPDEEYFGPLLQVVRVPNFSAAIEEANRTAYGLSAGILSDSRERYEEYLHQVRAGVINWNAQMTGASSQAPFGGLGCSGNNRPSAYYAADYCSYPVASTEGGALHIPDVPMPGIPVTPGDKAQRKDG